MQIGFQSKIKTKQNSIHSRSVFALFAKLSVLIVCKDERVNQQSSFNLAAFSSERNDSARLEW